MARRNSSSTPAAAETLVRAPEGFRDLGSVQAECWFALTEGNVMTGKLLGMYQMKDDRSKKPGAMKNFFQIEVTKSGAIGRYGKGEQAEEKEIPVGTIINLNYSTKTQVLETLIVNINNGAEYRIWIHCGKKIPLRSGNTMWNITCKAALVKAPLASASSEIDFTDDDEPVSSQGSDESDSAA